MKKVFCLATALLAVAATFLSCSKDDEEPIRLTLDEYYSIPIGHVLEVTPKVEGTQNGLYLWTIGDSTISTSSKLEFITATAGSYNVKLVVTEGSRKTTKEFTIQATNASYSKLSTLVYDYNPAPGRMVNSFSNKIAKTKAEALEMINNMIKTGTKLNLSLGCLGGSAVFAFDHTIMNVPGQDDFKVILSDENYRGLGIVYVAYDRNKNGKPDDDEWCEIPGNLEGTKEIVSDYEVTISHNRVDDTNEYISYYNWTDNKGNKGTQCMDYYEWISELDYIYPAWINEDIKCSGKMVMVNHDTFTKDAANNHYGHYLYPTGTLSGQSTPFDISKAVDAKGKPVSLPGIDFIKIKSAVFCEYPLNGYYSLVIRQVTDLHLK
jgi:hypothetical protein